MRRTRARTERRISALAKRARRIHRGRPRMEWPIPQPFAWTAVLAGGGARRPPRECSARTCSIGSFWFEASRATRKNGVRKRRELQWKDHHRGAGTAVDAFLRPQFATLQADDFASDVYP